MADDSDAAPGPSRLEQQIAFLLEADRLKGVLRRSRLINEDRLENSGEHSWHFALATLVLAEHCPEPVDLLKVLRMALIHDLVEIDAGDTFVYDEVGKDDQAAREQAAADRIFGLLPEDQARAFRADWDEFEAARTAEARLARAVDRLLPLLHNCHTRGAAWRKHGVNAGQVVAINRVIEHGAPDLWTYARRLIDEAVRDGNLEA
ncbi:MAG: HD domain-containing protein [Opitutales bacterium]